MSTKRRKLDKRYSRKEKRALAKRCFKAKSLVNKILHEEFGRKIFKLKHDDELRLTTLLVWRDRYKVSIRWMLRILIPIWSKTFGKYSNNKGLGCRVATLVGQKSEAIIREKLKREFPNNEQRNEWEEKERTKIKQELLSADDSSDDVDVKYRSILDASNPEKFVNRYEKELGWWKKKKTSSKERKVMKELKSRDFRDNPFI